MIRFSSFLALALALSAMAASADVLVTENGDRIHGQFMREASGMIVFQSDLFGVLSAPVGVARVETQDRPAADGEDASDPTQVTRGFKTDGPVASLESPVQDKQDPKWTRQVDLGVLSQTGKSDRSDFNLKLALERETDDNEVAFALQRNYGTTDGERSVDRTRGKLLLRQDVSNYWFARTATNYDRDTIRGIEHEGEQSLGLGLHLFENKELKMSVGAGAIARYRVNTGDDGFWTGLVDGFQSVTYKINDRLTLNQSLALSVPPTLTDEYQVKVDAALISKITETIRMSLRYELEYDRSLEPSSRDTRRFITSLGYVF